MGVGVVGRGLLHSRDEALVEVRLTNMRCVNIIAEGSVGEECSIGMNHDMDMCSATNVVTGEDGLELGDTVSVGLLDSPTKCGVDIGGIVRIAVSTGNNTRVDTSAVAVPDLDVDIRDGLTGVNVDDLVVEGNRNTRLIVRNILTDVLAANICKETEVNSSPQFTRESNSYNKDPGSFQATKDRKSCW